jgi:hypothetical protein
LSSDGLDEMLIIIDEISFDNESLEYKVLMTDVSAKGFSTLPGSLVDDILAWTIAIIFIFAPT